MSLLAGVAGSVHAMSHTPVTAAPVRQSSTWVSGAGLALKTLVGRPLRCPRPAGPWERVSPPFSSPHEAASPSVALACAWARHQDLQTQPLPPPTGPAPAPPLSQGCHRPPPGRGLHESPLGNPCVCNPNYTLPAGEGGVCLLCVVTAEEAVWTGGHLSGVPSRHGIADVHPEDHPCCPPCGPPRCPPASVDCHVLLLPASPPPCCNPPA